MRHLSIDGQEPGQHISLPEWPASARANKKNTEAMFEDELDATDEAAGMAFENKK